MEIREINPSDYIDDIVAFSTEGMNLTLGSASKTLDSLYQFGTSAEVIGRSNLFLGAFEGDEFIGFIFANDGSDKKADVEFYANFFRFLKEHFPGTDFIREYDRVNEEMLDTISPKPDAELTFFACKPGITGKGLGTKLMDEMARRLAGKFVFLYTDDGCTYQFYEHRGFTKAAQQTLNYTFKGEPEILECMIFTKQF